MSEQGRRHLHTFVDRRKVVIKAMSSTEEGDGVLSYTGDTRICTCIFVCMCMCECVLEGDSMVM